MSGHRIVVNVSTTALRRGLDLVEQGSYESLDDMVDALLSGRNGQPAGVDGSSAATDALPALLEMPAEPCAALAPEPATTTGHLLFLTNRLNPLKLSARVLANVGASEWPELHAFQRAAAGAARDVGLRLKAEDKEAGRKGQARRWVGYPVGDDESAAMERFIFSFTVAEDQGRAAGALGVLGLAVVIDGRVALTDAGWALAKAPSPLLDGGEGTMSEEEAEVLIGRLRLATDERGGITEFMKLVKRSAGVQSQVDEALGAAHPDWSADRAAAHRAAMLGRLTEVRALKVSGRGTTAQIEVLEADVMARRGGAND